MRAGVAKGVRHVLLAGFGDDDAAFLSREGFNSVRLGVIYKAVEPTPGTYDSAYLQKIAATAAIPRKARDHATARLPPRPLQRALPGRGLARLGRARRRLAGAAAAGLPRQLPRAAGAEPGVRQLLGQRARSRRSRPGGPLCRRLDTRGAGVRARKV